MPVYVALLRGINVGGANPLPMSELRALCAAADFRHAATYIQSGNVVFGSPLGEAAVRERLEGALARKMGKTIRVLVRTAQELASVLERNPFPAAAANRVIVFFLDEEPAGPLPAIASPGGEELSLSGREIFVHYPSGQGRSKLKVPFADRATGRNLNTVAQLVELGRTVAARP